MAQAIAKSEWGRYCDLISKSLIGANAEIEVASLELGDQIEAAWLPFLGITYDPKDDVIDIALDGVDHIIYEPQELCADGDYANLRTLEIKGADGAQHLVRLRDALMLPAPH